MYFMHRLLDRLDKRLLFVSTNYLRIYPILQQLYGILSQTNVLHFDKEWSWLKLFIDFNSIQRCLEVDKISATALVHNSYFCSDSSSSELNRKWNEAIDSLIISLKALNSDGIRDVLLAEIIEKLLSY